MMQHDCSVWAERFAVLMGLDGLAWLLCVCLQMHCAGWSDWSVCPTWLLCMDWQIHCPGWSWYASTALYTVGWQIHYPGYKCWLSNSSFLYGLTDPLSNSLSWLVLILIWVDYSQWADISTVVVGPYGLTWFLLHKVTKG